jgi:hypothetical protein
MLISRLAYTLTFKMEAEYFSENLVDFQRPTRRYIQEDNSLYICFPPVCLRKCRRVPSNGSQTSKSLLTRHST